MKPPILSITLIVIISNFVDGKKKDGQAAQDFIEKELKKHSGPCPKLINTKNVNHWRWTFKPKESIPCVLLGLQRSVNDGHLWSALGTLYTRIGQSTQASTCFKHGTRLTGKISPSVKSWDFIGPFVIGKMELDGDPLEAYGGIQNVSKYRNVKKMKFYSELVPGGEIKWETYEQKGEMMKISPKIDWNDIVSSLGSMGITEWQGWVVGEFAVNDKDQNVLIQCLGAHTVYVDDIPLTGDVYHRNQFWMGIHLAQGVHTLAIRLRTKVTANFQCNLKISQSVFDVLSPHFLPDLIDGYLFGQYIALPVANYHHKKWLKITRALVTEQSDGHSINCKLVTTLSVAPGQIVSVPLMIQVTDPASRVVSECSTVVVKIKLSTSEGSLPFTLELRCRKLRESFLFTFMDHDGSVQHAAAIAPVEDCKGTGACPVILTNHGTSVPPQNHADSYKRMEDGEFLFGAKSAWVLAPSRHGAHNWEGPGSLTSLTALDRLADLTNQHSWISSKANSKAVVYAGHSMGGHGSWHLATHYPDRALAVLSLAGWIKKEEYGDSNLFFKHDIATSHVEPAVKSVMEACIAENEADKHVSNLQDIPVLARIGQKDRTVHPFFMRRMYRLLKEIKAMVNYTELQGKEHWWWDTWLTNDGGTTNDKQLREFTDKHVENFVSRSASCDQSGKDCTQQESNKYKDEHKTFVLTCYNPALGDGLNGIRVLQQRAPLKLSKVEANIENNFATLTTTNVAVFVITEPFLRPMNWRHKVLMEEGKKEKMRKEEKRSVLQRSNKDHSKVDGEIINLQEYKDDVFVTGLHLCFRKTDSWTVCSKDTSIKGRGPETYGPARRIAESPFVIVIDTDSDHSSEIQRLAVYIANLFFLTSEATTSIYKLKEMDKEVAKNQNLIILTLNPEHLGLSGVLPALHITDSTVKLKRCKFSSPRTGVLALSSNNDNPQKLNLWLTGNSLQGLQDAVSLAAPTIPPMTRSPFSNLLPDFVVTGPEFGLKGPGGFLCAGFWGNNWEYRPDLSSCVCH